MRRVLALGLLSAAAVTILPQSVRADLVFFATRPAFNAAFPGLPVEDFEKGKVGPGASLPLPAPLTSASSNAVFGPGDILPGLAFQNTPGPTGSGLALAGSGFSGLPSKTLFTNNPADSMDISFATGATAVGLDLYSESVSSTLRISIFGASGLLGTIDVPALSTGVPTFFGVSSTTEAISRINVNSLTNQAEGIDNVAAAQQQVIPEPSALALLGLGACAVLGYRWRRRYSANREAVRKDSAVC